MTDTDVELLWRPDPTRDNGMTAFRSWLRSERGHDFPDYESLWEWSVSDLEGFWGAIASYFDVRFHTAPERVLGSTDMPGARWFPGSTLNYAEHALRRGADDDLAVIFHREDGFATSLSFGALRSRVAAFRAALVSLGVSQGDRVVALVPNAPEALIAFLAAASLGATWSSCSPDFGARAVADRFTQISPVVFVAVSGYVYNGRSFDCRPVVEEIRSQIPSLRATVLIDYLDNGATLPDTLSFSDLVSANEGAPLEFTPVPFDHPLWVLYSSGTTGLPKGIVQGHGGIVVEHLKMLALHSDLGPGDRFFWFTTTGWMMWNYLVGGLLVGTTIVLFDGSPAYPSLNTLWHLAEQHRVTYFGTSAPYVQSCLKEGLDPSSRYDLTALRVVGSTGAPLTPEGFRWIASAVGKDVQIASVSGGTDLCTAFVAASPDRPVWLGELSCRALGAAVYAFDEAGTPLEDEVGELVITKPMPSMPVFFWGDEDGSRLRDAYFDTYPGIWRHGDWIRITPRGSAVIYGRSDSTLNRGGVRMGTSEFYRVVESIPGVVDSLVIDTSGVTEGELLCFVVLDGVSLSDVEPLLRQELRSSLSPRHVPNRFVAVAEIPRTLNGKKCEVPVKKILAGVDPEKAVSRGALRNPESLQPFLELASG
ncbi:acetoacetate--CoA ligase [Lentzea flava]|uniref:Acetoacetyl-CoA synthetase n=1 Tax=Lentzea flava TaxID=103732 RepID=A0ABQ2UFI7_9PSEU|nr:acetoacetate--CoA ligase [Lentzea flava]MCP2197788.1 acetoacetyl-CoA synthetase [Lentzea flava]GGU22190.1 acetoacetyl-CoA synthetase [Lentzea flava]